MSGNLPKLFATVQERLATNENDPQRRMRTQYYLGVFFLLAFKLAPFVLLIIGSFLVRQKLRVRSTLFMLFGAIIAFLGVTAKVVLSHPFNLLDYPNGSITTGQEMYERIQLVEALANSAFLISTIGILLFSISFLLVARKLPQITTPS